MQFAINNESGWGGQSHRYSVVINWRKPHEPLTLQALLLTRNVRFNYSNTRYATTLKVFFDDLGAAQAFKAEAESL